MPRGKGTVVPNHVDAGRRDAARVFYAAILGDFVGDIVLLPEQARTRGAPAHWLGQILVADLDTMVRAFETRGATQLGPTQSTSDGGRLAILRDPGGAVVSLVEVKPETPRQPDIVWHALQSENMEATTSAYCDLFEWQLVGPQDSGPLGVHQEFAWKAGQESVGSMIDVSKRPEVHPHWLFHFGVRDLDSTLADVRAAHGVVLGSIDFPNGGRVAMCEDPQGAVFGLLEVTAGEPVVLDPVPSS